MNRLAATRGLACAVLVATGVVVGAAPAAQAEDRTLRFTGTLTDLTTVPDRTGAQQPGDRAVFVVVLSRDGRTVGRSPHECTAVNARYTLCTSVIDLPRGQISLQTALTTETTAPVVAVTGGTGRFRGASGELRIAFNDDGTQDWRLQLDTP